MRSTVRLTFAFLSVHDFVLQRMERFGELKLLSFTKHIEIERPSPVSSQHVVGLELTMFVGNAI
jgi:hypothetical protein